MDLAGNSILSVHLSLLPATRLVSLPVQKPCLMTNTVIFSFRQQIGGRSLQRGRKRSGMSVSVRWCACKQQLCVCIPALIWRVQILIYVSIDTLMKSIHYCYSNHTHNTWNEHWHIQIHLCTHKQIRKRVCARKLCVVQVIKHLHNGANIHM
jgi:hypothetical protein